MRLFEMGILLNFSSFFCLNYFREKNVTIILFISFLLFVFKLIGYYFWQEEKYMEKLKKIKLNFYLILLDFVKCFAFAC